MQVERFPSEAQVKSGALMSSTLEPTKKFGIKYQICKRIISLFDGLTED